MSILITASEVIQHLRIRFDAPAFCFLEQVADGTGARQYRWADAVAMSVWPSRGYAIHGIEVKVSRYDWKKELEQPTKSAAVQQYCNRWWIATPDESIIQNGELPPTWGWMVISGKSMKVIIDAPALTPKPISVEFLASILRNVQKADDNAIEAIRRKAHDEGREEGNKSLRESLARLRSEVEEFQSKSGIRIDEYSGGDLGDAVRTLHDLKWRVSNIGNAIKACAEIQGMLEKVQTLADLSQTDHTSS